MTKDDAVAAISKLPLDAAVVVIDVSSTKDGARRVYTFPAFGGGTCSIDIDADPTDAQLETLANNLPMPDEQRDVAADTLVAAAVDAGAVDAGAVDAGAVDAGAVDAGAVDVSAQPVQAATLKNSP